MDEEEDDDAQSQDSQPQSPPSSHHHHPAVTLALPIQTPAGGRDDCWSEGATSALIDAWGERYLLQGRGIINRDQWQEVADAVSSRIDYTKTPKTHAQCKNRVDTLKKKYKRHRSTNNPSSWQFFGRLDRLLGPTVTTAGGAAAAALPSSFPRRHRTQHKIRSPAASSSSSDSFPPPVAAENGRDHLHRADKDNNPMDRTAGKGMSEVARAIVRFGEVYERVERSKVRMAAEMEKRRMELARELEVQRSEFFMKTQMELSLLDRRHCGGKRKRDADKDTANGSHGSKIDK